MAKVALSNRIRLSGWLVAVNLLTCLGVSHAANLIWTNTAASGSFQDAKVWQPNGPPGGTDTASFTNALTYTANFSSSVLNDSAFVGAFRVGTAGSLTLSIGSGNTWTLTNAFRIATNSANTAANGMTVILTSGTLAVTNSAGTGLLNIGEGGTGTFILNGGAAVVNNLMATGTAGKSTLTLTSGTLTTLNGASISNNSTFTIGGTSGQQVTWNVQGGSNWVLLTAGNIILGNTATSSGNAMAVSGANTVWIGNRALVVGNNGFSNNVMVSAGALLDSTGAFIGSGGSGGQGNSNAVVITGANSVWTNRGTLVLGSVNGFWNTLTVTTGGSVFNNDATIGAGGAGGRATSNLVIVTGTASRWITSGGVTLGGSSGGGNNMLFVTNNGFASVSSDLVVGANVDMGQLVRVTSNGLLTVGGSILLGNGTGNGNSLQILDQGTVVTTNVIVGPNSSSADNTITNSGGSLFVTNSSVTATLDVRRGAVALNSGTLSADKLILTTGSSGTLAFNGGNLNVSSTFVTNTLTFVVGDGSGATATLNLLGGTHNFNNGLTNQSDGVVTGGGVVQSPFQVVNLGSIIATSATAELRFTNTTTVGNPGTLGASTGATLTFGTAGVGSTIITNRGTISMTGGTLRSGNITNLATGFIGGSGTLAAAVGNSGTISASGGNLVLVSGLIGTTNSGTLSVSAGGNLIAGTASNLVINNNATIDLLGGNLFSGNISNLAGATVRGVGTLTPVLANAGNVTATNGELRLLGVVSGAGAYRAVAGAAASTLTFAGGGSISALANTGATVRLENVLTNTSVFVNGGTLMVAGATYQSAANVTNATTAVIANSGAANINASLVNLGSILVTNATVAISNLLAQGGTVTIGAGGTLSTPFTAALTNFGTINLVGATGAGNNAVLNLGTAMLTNNAGGTITGGGVVQNAAPLMNAGNIIGTSTVVELQFTNGNTVGNSGTLAVSGSATLTFGTAGTGSAILTNFGTITMNGGTLRSATITNLAGGVIGGTGTITGPVVNQGRVDLSATIANNFLQTAGTNTVTGSGTITGTATVTGGLFDLKGGTYTNAQMVLGGTGVLSNGITGATFNGGLNNAATVFVSADTFFNGAITNTGALFFRGAISNKLVNSGSVTLNNNATITGPATITAGSFDLNGKAESGGPIVISGTGVLTNGVTGGSSGANVGNAGAVFVSASTFFSGLVTNSGTFTFQGAISNKLVNSGTFRLNNTATITIAPINSGTIDVAASTLAIAPAWANSGTVLLAGGTLAGGSVTNNSSGDVTGFGNLSAVLVNAGSFFVTNGTLTLAAAPVQNGTITVANNGTLTVAPAWSNNGTLLVMGGVVNGGNLTNAVNGVIRNAGTISSVLVNFGDVEALNGSGLTFNGATNATGGSMVISNSTLTATVSLRNLGNLALFNSAGTLQAGAFNSGSMVVSNGITTSAGSQLTVAGVLTNTGTVSFFHSVGTFSAPVVNSGAWITDPSTNIFQNTLTITSGGSIQMSAGDVYIFTNDATSTASFVNLSAQSNTFSTLPGKFLFDGTLALTQQFYTAGNNIGSLDTDGGTNTVAVSILDPNVLAQYSNNFTLGSLEIASGSTVDVADAFLLGGRDHGGLEAALFLTNLVIDPGAILVVSNNVQIYFINSNGFSAASITLLGDGGVHQLLGPSPAVVPEPGVLLLWLAGAVTLYAARRRRM